MTLIEELEEFCELGNSFEKDCLSSGLVTEEEYDEYGAYIEGYYDCLKKVFEFLKNHSDWIPTDDPRKPDYDEPVFLSCNCGAIKRVVIGYYSRWHEVFMTNEMFIEPERIKAWQPLPKPYEEDEK